MGDDGDRHGEALKAIFNNFASGGGGKRMDLEGFLQLCNELDVVPTLFTQAEVEEKFVSIAKESSGQDVGFGSFKKVVKLLGLKEFKRSQYGNKFPDKESRIEAMYEYLCAAAEEKKKKSKSAISSGGGNNSNNNNNQRPLSAKKSTSAPSQQHQPTKEPSRYSKGGNKNHQYSFDDDEDNVPEEVLQDEEFEEEPAKVVKQKQKPASTPSSSSSSSAPARMGNPPVPSPANRTKISGSPWDVLGQVKAVFNAYAEVDQHLTVANLNKMVFDFDVVPAILSAQEMANVLETSRSKTGSEQDEPMAFNDFKFFLRAAAERAYKSKGSPDREQWLRQLFEQMSLADASVVDARVRHHKASPASSSNSAPTTVTPVVAPAPVAPQPSQPAPSSQQQQQQKNANVEDDDEEGIYEDDTETVDDNAKASMSLEGDIVTKQRDDDEEISSHPPVVTPSQSLSERHEYVPAGAAGAVGLGANGIRREYVPSSLSRPSSASRLERPPSAGRPSSASGRPTSATRPGSASSVGRPESAKMRAGGLGTLARVQETAVASPGPSGLMVGGDATNGGGGGGGSGSVAGSGGGNGNNNAGGAVQQSLGARFGASKQDDEEEDEVYEDDYDGEDTEEALNAALQRGPIKRSSSGAPEEPMVRVSSPNIIPEQQKQQPDKVVIKTPRETPNDENKNNVSNNMSAAPPTFQPSSPIQQQDNPAGASAAAPPSAVKSPTAATAPNSALKRPGSAERGTHAALHTTWADEVATQNGPAADGGGLESLAVYEPSMSQKSGGGGGGGGGGLDSLKKYEAPPAKSGGGGGGGLESLTVYQPKIVNGGGGSGGAASGKSSSARRPTSGGKVPSKAKPQQHQNSENSKPLPTQAQSPPPPAAAPLAAVSSSPLRKRPSSAPSARRRLSGNHSAASVAALAARPAWGANPSIPFRPMSVAGSATSRSYSSLSNVPGGLSSLGSTGAGGGGGGGGAAGGGGGDDEAASSEWRKKAWAVVKHKISACVKLGVLSRNSEATLVVEHCQNCERHRMSLRHKPEKYGGAFETLQRMLSRLDNLRLNIVRTPNPRLGSFEITLKWGHNGYPYHVPIHSKLHSRHFPNLEEIFTLLASIGVTDLDDDFD